MAGNEKDYQRLSDKEVDINNDNIEDITNPFHNVAQAEVSDLNIKEDMTPLTSMINIMHSQPKDMVNKALQKYILAKYIIFDDKKVLSYDYNQFFLDILNDKADLEKNKAEIINFFSESEPDKEILGNFIDNLIEFRKSYNGQEKITNLNNFIESTLVKGKFDKLTKVMSTGLKIIDKYSDDKIFHLMPEVVLESLDNKVKSSGSDFNSNQKKTINGKNFYGENFINVSLAGKNIKNCDFSSINIESGLDLSNVTIDKKSYESLLPSLRRAEANGVIINYDGLKISDYKAAIDKIIETKDSKNIGKISKDQDDMDIQTYEKIKSTSPFFPNEVTLEEYYVHLTYNTLVDQEKNPNYKHKRAPNVERIFEIKDIIDKSIIEKRNFITDKESNKSTQYAKAILIHLHFHPFDQDILDLINEGNEEINAVLSKEFSNSKSPNIKNLVTEIKKTDFFKSIHNKKEIIEYKYLSNLIVKSIIPENSNNISLNKLQTAIYNALDSLPDDDKVKIKNILSDEKLFKAFFDNLKFQVTINGQDIPISLTKENNEYSFAIPNGPIDVAIHNSITNALNAKPEVNNIEIEENKPKYFDPLSGLSEDERDCFNKLRELLPDTIDKAENGQETFFGKNIAAPMLKRFSNSSFIKENIENKTKIGKLIYSMNFSTAWYLYKNSDKLDKLAEIIDKGVKSNKLDPNLFSGSDDKLLQYIKNTKKNEIILTSDALSLTADQLEDLKEISERMYNIENKITKMEKFSTNIKSINRKPLEVHKHSKIPQVSKVHQPSAPMKNKTDIYSAIETLLKNNPKTLEKIPNDQKDKIMKDLGIKEGFFNKYKNLYSLQENIYQNNATLIETDIFSLLKDRPETLRNILINNKPNDWPILLRSALGKDSHQNTVLSNNKNAEITDTQIKNTSYEKSIFNSNSKALKNDKIDRELQRLSFVTHNLNSSSSNSYNFIEAIIIHPNEIKGNKTLQDIFIRDFLNIPNITSKEFGTILENIQKNIDLLSNENKEMMIYLYQNGDVKDIERLKEIIRTDFTKENIPDINIISWDSKTITDATFSKSAFNDTLLINNSDIKNLRFNSVTFAEDIEFRKGTPQYIYFDNCSCKNLILNSPITEMHINNMKITESLDLRDAVITKSDFSKISLAKDAVIIVNQETKMDTESFISLTKTVKDKNLMTYLTDNIQITDSGGKIAKTVLEEELNNIKVETTKALNNNGQLTRKVSHRKENVSNDVAPKKPDTSPDISGTSPELQR